MTEKSESSVYVKKIQYKCAICGEVYNDVQSRMNCEIQCLRKQQEEEQKAAEAKLKAEKDSRYREVAEAVDNAVALIAKYNEDYNESFVYITNKSNKKSDAKQKARQAFARSCFWF